MQDNVPIAVETYRQPETRAVLKVMTDPRPHKWALSYLKAQVRQILGHQKQALWTRPIDDLSFVAKDSIRTAGAAGGAVVGNQVAGLVARGNPYARLVGTLLGSITGGYAAGRVGDAALDATLDRVNIPEPLTHVNILSKNQSRYSNMGSALGIASVVPLAARIIMKGETNPLLAVGGALGSAYLMSRLGNAAGNVAGYYADRRDA